MNPQLNAFLSAVRYLLVVIGGIMMEQGLDHTVYYKWLVIATGSIMVVGPAVWGVWSSVYNWYKAAAVGVQAGINLTVSGNALASDGKTVVSANDGSTPPKPVTVATATEIVKDFASATPPAKV